MAKKETAVAAIAATASQYYSIKNLLATKATYMMMFGERSNGKTYAVLEECIKDHFQTGAQVAILRRFAEDFRGKRGAQLFEGLCANGVVDTWSNGEYNSVYYYSSRWYFQKVEDGVVVNRAAEPFAYAFALTNMEHEKGNAYPKIRNIFFDEFMSRAGYLTDEFILFMNTISTIVRQRNDVRIFMAANSVNKSCPYANEMGLKKFKNMKQGDLDVYTYGNSGLTVAVEYTDTPSKSKPSDVYFAFGNPKLQMITGKNGGWEIDIYPHCPVKFERRDILYIYFVIWEDDILQCELVMKGSDMFTYVHRKTTPLKDDDNLVYTTEFSHKWNYRRRINKPTSEAERRIYSFYLNDKVFYQDNEVGEIMRNYLMFCTSSVK